MASHILAADGHIIVYPSFYDTQGKMQAQRRSLGRLKGAALAQVDRSELRYARELEKAALGMLKTDIARASASNLNRASTAFVKAGMALAASWRAARAADRFFDHDNLDRVQQFASWHMDLTITVEDDRSLTGPGKWRLQRLDRPALPALWVDFDRLY